MAASRLATPWSSVGYLTYKRTYARRLDETSTRSVTEEWPDTVHRVLRACDTQLGVGFTDDEKERLENHLLELRGTVAGRFLWQLGTSTVEKLGLASLQNCACVCVDEPIRPFTWTMDMLMLGCGVGFNIQREYVFKLPRVIESFVAPTRYDSASADFIVPDTREGWVKLLEYTLRAAFNKGDKRTFSYSTQLIRGAGAPIKGFGGTASGPEILCDGIGNISSILMGRAGKQLRPIDCLDIMNIIGSIVVAGNVRRSAEIAIGDMDDFQYLRSKRWDLGNIPNWRSNSNNSVVCNDFELLPDELWKGYMGNGEPFGLINLKLARTVGRTGERHYPDKEVIGFNPCAEQSLANYETCCLAEIFLPQIRSQTELLDVAVLLYRVCKHSLNLPCHNSETEAVVHRNQRMGIGITGYLQATEEQRGWLKETYEKLREYDTIYSAERGWPASIKLTTVKPSGTLSLLPGVTPGCHPAYSQYMVRRIRLSSDSPLVATIRESGFRVEPVRGFDGREDRTTVVAEFPFCYPDGTVLAKDMSAIDQLEVVRRLQTEWSDNAVSCTVYYKPEELEEIKAYLAKYYNKHFKSLSFLRHTGHGFIQAPLEEISKEEYEKLVKKTKLITSVESAEFESDDECAAGVCPIK
jgi:ribonucleoside-triphosphate reductase